MMKQWLVVVLVLLVLAPPSMAQTQTPTITPLMGCCDCGADTENCIAPNADWTCNGGCAFVRDAVCVAAPNTPTNTATNTATATSTATATATDTPSGTWVDTFSSGTTLSGNWVQWTNDFGNFSVSGGAAIPGSNNDNIAEYIASGTSATQYACVKLGAYDASEFIGVGVGSTATNSDTMLCLASNTNIQPAYFDGNNPTLGTAADVGGGSIASGDYIAARRTGADTFDCWYCDVSGAGGCDDTGDWVSTGSMTVPTGVITTPGYTGIYGGSITESIASFGGGTGTTLPAPNTCAGE